MTGSTLTDQGRIHPQREDIPLYTPEWSPAASDTCTCLDHGDDHEPAFYLKNDGVLYGQRSSTRKGGAYFLVLASAIVITATVIGLSFVTMQFRRTSKSQVEIDQAVIHAELGIRHALRFPATVPTWRDLLASGVWLQDIQVDGATYTVAGVDPVDGDLSNGGDVWLTATAKVGNVSRTVRVEAIEQKSPHEVLKYAVVSGVQVKLQHTAQVNGNAASNGNIAGVGSKHSVNGNGEAVGTISATVTGTVTEGIAPKTLPDTAAILQYYSSIATVIPYQGSIVNVLLSPQSNPFGATNADGVYLMQCGGGGVAISNCRIVGTLILENCSGGSSIDKGINWQPARADYPALIVNQEGLNIYPLGDLNEQSIGVDLSLEGEPGYGSATDSYPSLIRGTVYIDGYVYIYRGSHLLGTVVTTDFLWIQNNAIVDYDPAVLDNPPPGFYESKLGPVGGTWQLVAP